MQRGREGVKKGPKIVVILKVSPLNEYVSLRHLLPLRAENICISLGFIGKPCPQCPEPFITLSGILVVLIQKLTKLTKQPFLPDGMLPYFPAEQWFLLVQDSEASPRATL